MPACMICLSTCLQGVRRAHEFPPAQDRVVLLFLCNVHRQSDLLSSTCTRDTLTLIVHNSCVKMPAGSSGSQAPKS